MNKKSLIVGLVFGICICVALAATPIKNAIFNGDVVYDAGSITKFLSGSSVDLQGTTKINGTAITASASDINAMTGDGITTKLITVKSNSVYALKIVPTSVHFGITNSRSFDFQVATGGVASTTYVSILKIIGETTDGGSTYTWTPSGKFWDSISGSMQIDASNNVVAMHQAADLLLSNRVYSLTFAHGTNVTVAGSLAANGAAGFTVAGASTLSGAVGCSTGLTVSGTAAFNGAGGVTVAANETITGNLIVKGAANIFTNIPVYSDGLTAGTLCYTNGNALMFR